MKCAGLYFFVFLLVSCAGENNYLGLQRYNNFVEMQIFYNLSIFCTICPDFVRSVQKFVRFVPCGNIIHRNFVRDILKLAAIK